MIHQCFIHTTHDMVHTPSSVVVGVGMVVGLIVPLGSIGGGGGGGGVGGVKVVGMTCNIAKKNDKNCVSLLFHSASKQIFMYDVIHDFLSE